MKPMKFKDVAHLYLGVTLRNSGILSGQLIDTANLNPHCWSNIIPILRPLSDMTEDEHKELYAMIFKKSSDYRDAIMAGEVSNKDVVGFKITYTPPESNKLDKGYEWVRYRKLLPTQFLWMLGKGFDLFGLIPLEQAIDSTTLKSQLNENNKNKS